MIYSFSDCELDAGRRTLTRGGKEVPVEPLVHDILGLLAEHAGSVVTRDQLIDAVWQGRIVSEAAISVRINAARSAVGDNGKDQKIIRTVPRRGFEMVAAVSRVEAPSAASPAATPDQTIRYASSEGGASIAWSTIGEGPPVLLGMHHLSNLEADWQSSILGPGIRRIGEGHRLVRHDFRGAGLSDRLQPGDGIDTHVADMLAVADAAGLERFPIVAYLQNAAVAIRLAARYPERVSRMVLLNAYARGRALRAAAPPEPENDPFIALLRSGGWGDPEDGFMRAWTTMVLPMASSDEITELIRLIARAGPAQDALLSRDVIDQIDITDDLASVRAPTLVIHARLCSIHPASEGRRVAAGIPHAEFLEINSSNTFFITSDPCFERVMEATRGFLAQDNAG